MVGATAKGSPNLARWHAAHPKASRSPTKGWSRVRPEQAVLGGHAYGMSGVCDCLQGAGQHCHTGALSHSAPPGALMASLVNARSSDLVGASSKMSAYFCKQSYPLRVSDDSWCLSQSNFALRCCLLVQQNPRKLQTRSGSPSLSVPAVQQVHFGEPLPRSMHVGAPHAREPDPPFSCLEQPPQRHGRLGCLPSGSAGLAGHRGD